MFNGNIQNLSPLPGYAILNELQLDKGVLAEPQTSQLILWRQSSDGSWECVRSGSNPQVVEVAEHISAIQTSVTEGWKRAAFRLFGGGGSNMLRETLPNRTKVERSPGVGEEAVLLWTKQVVERIQETLKCRWPEQEAEQWGKNVYLLRGAGLSMQETAMPPPPVLSDLAPYVSVVGDINEGGKENCFCFKICHGDTHDLSRFSSDNFQKWLLEQNETLDGLGKLVEQTDLRTVHAFPEIDIPISFCNSSKYDIPPSHAVKIMEDNENNLRKAANDRRCCEEILHTLRNRVNSGETYRAEALHQSMVGMVRWMRLMSCQDPTFHERVHPMPDRKGVHDELENALRIGDIKSLRRIRLQDFQKLHQYILRSLKSVPVGSHRIVMLGGMHFSSGLKPAESRLAYADWTTELLENTLERCIVKDPDLGEMRFLVFQPLHYRE